MNTIKATADHLEITVYEPIESGFSTRIRDQLAFAEPQQITIRVNSPGGIVSEALAAFTLLRQHPARVTAYVDGLAASSASFLVMAADHVYMASTAILMVHNPWVTAEGDAKSLRDTANTLDKHRDVLLRGYGRSGLPRKRLIDLLDAETWMDADEALALGFIDEVLDAPGIAARADLNNFTNVPERIKALMDNTTQNNTREVQDQTLRDEQQRRQEIAASFDKFSSLRYSDMYELKAACLNDVKCSPQAAGEKILAKLAEGAEPLQAPRREGLDPTLPDDGYRNDFFNAATDAILMRHGVTLKDKHPGADDVVAMSTVDIARTFLSQRGRSIRSSKPSAIIKAAMTTSDLPDLLENVANKGLMNGFRESEAATHRIWTRQGMLTDFKPASRAAMSEAPSLDIVPENAEYKNGALSDAKETIRLDTYGKIVSVSRQMLVNDDLGELARLPFAMGQAAARKEADLVYGLLTKNPQMRDGNTLFGSAHANKGTAAALSVESLGEARKLMRLQKGLAGESTLNTSPRFLIVPASLETAAEQLLAAIRPSTVSEVVPNWVQGLTLVVDSRLDGDSETAWYLAANPEQVDTIEVARLDGDGVSTESNEGFFVDRTDFKVRLDVGAAVLDWRGLVMNEGA
ncbi:MAG: ClpP-like prohead protease/major capsid protein fusion protein [Halothiobacillaceae bacterium]